jgi:hypothetical protein
MSKEDDPLVPVFTPALVTLLSDLEKDKGAPLTEEEVEEVRDKATVIVLRRSRAEEMTKSRGFMDIDPKNCWSEWLAHRERLAKGRSSG